MRNNIYYQQLMIEQDNGIKAPRRISLKSKTLDGVRLEMAENLVARNRQELPTPGHRPLFVDCCQEYLEFHKIAKDSGKKKSTLSKENESLRRWIKFIGRIRVDRITPAMIYSFRNKRLKSGVKARTANLDVITLNNVLNFAKEQGHLTKLPTQEIKHLKVITPPRREITVAEFEKLCSAAIEHCPKSGQTMSDYFCFLAYGGGREQESLRVKWEDVYFDRDYLIIGQDGQTKNSHSRIVDFNLELKKHLKKMYARRRLDSPYLFPSSRNKGVPFKDLRHGLRIARSKAGLGNIGFHDLRALFVTYGIMSGVDAKTVSEWVGHRSGTRLVDKVYTKLIRGHKRHQARKVSFKSNYASAKTR